MAKLTVRAVNVNGLRSGLKPAAICLSFKNTPNTADITCLIDTRLDTQTENLIEDYWEGKTIFIHNETKNYQGIAILFSNNKCKLNNIEKDKGGRYAILNITYEGNDVLMIPIYAPSEKSTGSLFFQNLDDNIGKHSNGTEHIILLGDFNTTEHNLLDRKYLSINKDPSAKTLNILAATHGLEDAWRKQHPKEIVMTHNSHKNSTRIDRIYSSRQFRNRISKTDIIPFVHSDHDMVEIIITTNNSNNLGKGTWTLDREILKDTEYFDKVERICNKWQGKKDKFENTLLWWDSLKKKIRRESRSYSYEKKQNQNKYLKSLNKRLRNLKRKITPPEKMVEFTKQIQEEIKRIEIEKVKKHIKGAKARYVEEGERCTNYFFRLENKRKMDTIMNEIEKQDGTIATTTEEILKETKSFYQNLYKNKTENAVSEGLQNIFLSKIDKKLSTDQAKILEEDITEFEMKHAIFTTQKNKSPGPDGLPIEFYQTFYEILKNDLILLFRCIEAHETLSDSQQIAIIISTPKKGDIKKLENWRPISLLNSDCKILSKIFANRIQKVLPHIINEDQSGNIVNRKIQDNLSIIRDMINFANETKEKYCIISIDQKKAFDNVNWGFLQKILIRFQFGKRFQKWIKVFYHNIKSAVKVNGKISGTFEIQQGVRQGCPLSPFLYGLYVEILAENIRKDRSIKGIKIEKTLFKISLFADDATLFLNEDSSIYALETKLNEFKLANGSEINRDKCNGLWLGSNKNRQDNPLNFNWSSERIKILGLYFGDEKSIEMNFEIKCGQFVKTLKMWEYRDLSLKGKTIIHNQLAASKIVYASQVFACPTHIITRMNKATLEFFAGKISNPDINMLYLPIEAGGLGLVDIKRKMQAIRLNWVGQLYREKNTTKRKILMEFFLNKIEPLNLGINVFKAFLISSQTRQLPQFYKNLIADWIKLTKNERITPKTLELIYNEPIYHNTFIPGKTVYEGRPKMIHPQNPGIKQELYKFELIGDLCHQYKKGFNNEPEWIEMSGNKNISEVVKTVIKNMSKDWRSKIINQEPPKYKQNDIQITITNSVDLPTITLITNATSKKLYENIPAKTLCTLKNDKGSIGTYIYTNLENTLGRINWKKLFKNMFENHIDKKSTDVQYKFIHRKIKTRQNLFYANLQNDIYCTRCKAHTETLNHIFIECSSSTKLWEQLKEQAKRLLNTERLTWHTPKVITIGFLDENIKTNALKQTLEDMRLAYFHAIWTSRNKSMWDSEDINPQILYKDRLKKIFSHRFHKAQKQNDLLTFETNYGVNKICTITKKKLIEIKTLTQDSIIRQTKRKITHIPRIHHNKKTKSN